MARYDRAPFPSADQIDHGPASVPVEVVCRLVQQQEIRLFQDQRSQGRPTALSAGKRGKQGLRLGRQTATGKRGIDPGGQSPVGFGQVID